MAAKIASPSSGKEAVSIEKMSSEMALFSLAQKIFVIKKYYSTGESVRNVLNCLNRRYGIKFNDDNHRVITEIVQAFETKGSLVERFFYNVVAGGPPLAPTPIKVPVRAAPQPAKVVVQEVAVEEEGEEEEQIVFGEEVEDAGNAMKEETIYEVVHEAVHDHGVELLVDFAEGQIDSGTVTVSSVKKQMPTPMITTIPPRKFHPASYTNLCPECGETVPKNRFAVHMRNHKAEAETADQIHECQKCERVFLTNELLKAHTKQEHPKMFICEICAKVSKTKSTHKAHMFVHETERPHECPHCPKRFVRQVGLRRHLLTHTGEKPLKCRYCDARFAAHMGLQMHERSHTGERPYECKHCGKRFIGSPALNAHLKSHAGEYTFTCPVCPGRYKTLKTLQEHLLNKHNMHVTEVEKEEEETLS